MRRTKPALLLLFLATWVAPVSAQNAATSVSGLTQPAPQAACSCGASGSSGCNASVPVAPAMTGCGNGTGSQLAAYMNCFPNHPDLWVTYPAERAARLDHLYHHLNGCDCLNPKRGLHAHPSHVCGHVSGVCDSEGCDEKVVKAPIINRYKLQPREGFATLHAAPSSTPEPIVDTKSLSFPKVMSSKSAPLASFKLLKPSSPSKEGSWSTLGPVAKPASSDVSITPLR
jgi:hypothetical protein